MLPSEDLRLTAEGIARLQMPNGMIPWFPEGHCDPWNHVESAMALATMGLTDHAERAYEWLVETQNSDGSWFHYYWPDGTVESFRLDTNVTCYIAVGVWHHYLTTGDLSFLERMWPVVERAIDFALRLQQPGGEILWCVEPDLQLGRFALLTGCSSIYHSLRCAAAMADTLGRARPGWEWAAGQLAHAIVHDDDAFEDKSSWAMDWYYPVLSGALRGEAGRQRLLDGWDTFVLEGRGVRCVKENPWVTAAETCECVMALDAVGLRTEAETLFDWSQQLRDLDGMYWTGMVFPQRRTFPNGERSTYTAAAVVLAADVLRHTGPTAEIFHGDRLPAGLDLTEQVPDPD